MCNMPDLLNLNFVSSSKEDIMPLHTQEHTNLLDQETSLHASYTNTVDQSKYWISIYHDDIFHTLLEVEKDLHEVKLNTKQHKEERLDLIAKMKHASQELGLFKTTLHSATYFLDTYMTKTIIRKDFLELLIMTCLFVAAKLEETDTNIPKFTKINKIISGGKYTLQDYVSLETNLLETLKFSLSHPTTATFVEYFSKQIVTLDDFRMYANNWNNGVLHSHQNIAKKSNGPLFFGTYQEMLNVLNSMMIGISDLSLNCNDENYLNAVPSLKASACIGCVRMINYVEPIWTPYLITTTGYSYEAISPFVNILANLFERAAYDYNHVVGNAKVFANSPDSGISSCSHCAGNCTVTEKVTTARGTPIEIINTDDFDINCPQIKKPRFV